MKKYLFENGDQVLMGMFHFKSKHLERFGNAQLHVWIRYSSLSLIIN